MMAIKIGTKVTFISTLCYAVIRAFFLDTLILLLQLVFRCSAECGSGETGKLPMNNTSVCDLNKF